MCRCLHAPASGAKGACISPSVFMVLEQLPAQHILSLNSGFRLLSIFKGQKISWPGTVGEVITQPGEKQWAGVDNLKEVGKATSTPKANQDVYFLWKKDASCCRTEKQLAIRNETFASKIMGTGLASFP